MVYGKRNLLLTHMAAMFLVFGAGSLQAKTLFVSPSGSDGNSGTSKDKPLKSLGEALERAVDFDEIQLKSGGEWRVTSPIKITRKGLVITGYDGTTKPVLNGNGNVPSEERSAMFVVAADQVRVADIRFSNSGGHAIAVQGDNVVLDGLDVINPNTNGVLVDSASGVKVLGCTIKGANSGYPKGMHPWGSAISLRSAKDFTVDGNQIYEGWGEGIMPWLGAERGTIRKNTIYSQHAVGIYVNSSRKIDIYSNTIVGSSKSAYYRSNGYTGPGIALNNETYFYTSWGLPSSMVTSDLAIYDNIIASTDTGIAFWNQYSGTNYSNIRIVHNSLIDNRVQMNASDNVRFSGSEFANNMVLSLSGGTYDVGNPPTGSGFGFYSNFWTAPPKASQLRSSLDTIGGAKLEKMSGWKSFGSIGEVKRFYAQAASGSATKGAASSLFGQFSLASFFNGAITTADDLGIASGGGSSGNVADLTPLPPISVSIQ